MDTITMWAKKSSGVADARKLASPAVDVRGVITSTDAAKIRKDAELAIEKDEKNRLPLPYNENNPASGTKLD